MEFKGKENFLMTMVYGFNKEKDRLPLWNDLIKMNVNDPWIIL